MWFESITANHFGPFHNDGLDFAPGMNVIYGLNEAGKSSWRAALYAGLCGMPRGRGASRKEHTEFVKRHKPWDNPRAWEVSTVVVLADGRRVELRRDLVGWVGNRVRDVDMAGRDYSRDIIFEDSPDGSRWLGLNRRSFLSIACVEQADVLGVLGSADALQEDLQRAAATAREDATAAKALTRLGTYRKERVGSKRAPTKPLLRSARAVTNARDDLQSVQAKHGDYKERRLVVDQLERKVQDMQRQADAAKAALAVREAEQIEARLERVRTLDALFPNGAPRASAADEELAVQVMSALRTWWSLPVVQEPIGQSVEEIEQELDAFDSKMHVVASTPARWRLSLATGALAVAGGIGIGAVWPDLLPVGVAVAAAGLAVAVVGLVMGHSASQKDDIRSETVLALHRETIVQRLSVRRREESAHEADLRRWTDALEQLRSAAEAVGVQARTAEEIVGSLSAWQESRRQSMAEAEKRAEQWDERGRILGEFTFGQFREEAERLRKEAKRLVEDVGEEAMRAFRSGEVTAQVVAARQREADDARDEWNEERVRLEEFANTLESVADAEDALDGALRERERFEQLDWTIERTMELLKRAQERVHRDIAPVFRSTVLEWLPRVTKGRYSDCTIDPKTLGVDVSGTDGRWRKAVLLSHGTTEQVYLLLRLAMARHMTAEGEVCPLILDDVVSASDADRKRAVLETLLAISESTQVILFTHENDVCAWAEERLTEPHNRLITLDPLGVPA